MARIQNPILLSTHFGIQQELFDKHAIIDPFINVDTQIFIDPVLLCKSSNKLISEKSIITFRNHFSNFVRLISISEKEGDVAWKAAAKLLDLREPPENGLGYGGSGRSGSSRPEDVRDAIMRTTKEIIHLGSKDPEMISLMGFFEENVGPDTISDFTTRVIIKELSEITYNFCTSVGIPTEFTNFGFKTKLPVILSENGDKKYLVLVPKDIVRELPIARDFPGIEKAIEYSNNIKHSVNYMLADIARPTVSERKGALRLFALSSPKNFEEFLAVVKDHTDTYDENKDVFAYYKMKSIFAHGFPGIGSAKKYNFSQGSEYIKELVLDTISLFKQHVENGNLWEQLWEEDKPKKERASQLIYYAIADAYCRANNVDISPEANMGGGPIDFKFSKGYNAKILVEMKRSGGSVRHGYEKQLEIYLRAASTDYGIFVIIDYGDMGNKLSQIEKIKMEKDARGERTSDIIVIDATKKLSASKRN